MPDFSLLIEEMYISLDSPKSYLYEGIIDLLTDSLKDLFNTVL